MPFVLLRISPTRKIRLSLAVVAATKARGVLNVGVAMKQRGIHWSIGISNKSDPEIHPWENTGIPRKFQRKSMMLVQYAIRS